MRARLKICGVCDPNDAAEIARMGADYVGMIFARKSPRFVSDAEAAAICGALESSGARARRVGVFTDSGVSEILRAVGEFGLDAVQLHGGQDVGFARQVGRSCSAEVWKVVWLDSPEAFEAALEFPADVLLADSRSGNSPGGTGIVSDWREAAKLARLRPTALAGGISDENAARALAEVSPFCLDANSAVEISPRKKDLKKIEKILNIIGEYK